MHSFTLIKKNHFFYQMCNSILIISKWMNSNKSLTDHGNFKLEIADTWIIEYPVNRLPVKSINECPRKTLEKIFLDLKSLV